MKKIHQDRQDARPGDQARFPRRRPGPPAKKSTVAPKIKEPAAPIAARGRDQAEGRPRHDRREDRRRLRQQPSIRGDEPASALGQGPPPRQHFDGKWEIVLTGVEKPFEFKFLVNDEAGAWGRTSPPAPATR
jgi:hypothetical protein